MNDERGGRKLRKGRDTFAGNNDMNPRRPGRGLMAWHLHPLALIVFVLGWCGPRLISQPAPGPEATRASFQVRLGEEVLPFQMFSAFLLPGEMLEIEVLGAEGAFHCITSGGILRPRGLRRWDWRAPTETGVYPLVVVNAVTFERIAVNVFVTIALGSVQDGQLNGYSIGLYPVTPLRGLDVYRRPRGLVEVTEEMLDIPVSPHFTLGQFLCKQEGVFPKYLVLRERLLLKLEQVLEMLAQRGHSYATLHVMSGYRTPQYNRSIGNGIYSRHVYGDAADVFPDQYPVDNQIDDLNGDGRSDYGDARWLYELIEESSSEPGWGPFVGGLGGYPANRAHGPFVHVDARGFRARW